MEKVCCLTLILAMAGCAKPVPSIKEAEIGGSGWIFDEKGRGKHQLFFKENKRFIHVKNGVAKRGSWQITEDGQSISLRFDGQKIADSPFLVPHRLGQLRMIWRTDMDEVLMDRMDGSPPIP